MRRVLVSDKGGDRATGYTMSNKIVSLPDGFLCTWIDSRRQNQWAVLERRTGKILRSGPLGKPGLDNHCGAALATCRGQVHVITGGHHSPFEHYVLASVQDVEWRHVATIDAKATYPSLVCDSGGILHLAFRSPGDRWTLGYCRFRDGRWTPVRHLVRAHKPGYVYWTNGLAVGPHDRIHLVFGNTRVLRDGRRYFGASHLFSSDGGGTWFTSDGRALPALPVPAAWIPFLEQDMSPDRIQSIAQQRLHAAPGPHNLEYQQMVLSNPVVDAGGDLHFALHNGLTGTAALWSQRGNGWMVKPLTTIVTGDDPDKRVHMQSSLSLDDSGQLHAALMVEPTDECVWGPPGTYIVRVTTVTDGHGVTAECVCPPDREVAQWLPALEHPIHGGLDHVPPLLYTRGQNAGGFGDNKNTLETEVYLGTSTRYDDC